MQMGRRRAGLFQGTFPDNGTIDVSKQHSQQRCSHLTFDFLAFSPCLVICAKLLHVAYFQAAPEKSCSIVLLARIPFHVLSLGLKTRGCRLHLALLLRFMCHKVSKLTPFACHLPWHPALFTRTRVIQLQTALRQNGKHSTPCHEMV